MRKTSNTNKATKSFAMLTCLAMLTVSTSYVAAQYALDFNTRVNTQIGGRGHINSGFGGRNTYQPSMAYRSPSPYRVNARTGTYMYNPNVAFARSTYRPTTRGYGGYPSAYRYSGRVRVR